MPRSYLILGICCLSLFIVGLGAAVFVLGFVTTGRWARSTTQRVVPATTGGQPHGRMGRCAGGSSRSRRS